MTVSAKPAVSWQITPQDVVAETGEAVSVRAALVNDSRLPLILLEMTVQDDKGRTLQTERFWPGHRGDLPPETPFHPHNILPPGAAQYLPHQLSGRAGTVHLTFSARYLRPTEVMLKQTVFQLAFKRPVKRPFKEVEQASYIEQQLQLKENGPLAAWGIARQQQSVPPSPQFKRVFFKVSKAMLSRQQSSRTSYSLKVKAHPALEALRRAVPDATAWQADVPFFGVIFQRGDTVAYARQGRQVHKLGRASFAALQQLGHDLATQKKSRLSLHHKAKCFFSRFKGRVQDPAPALEQAEVIGQGMPFVMIEQQDLPTVWSCLAQDKATLIQSSLYNYLVVFVQ